MTSGPTTAEPWSSSSCPASAQTERSTPVQALVSEQAMTCGTGLCMGCVLPAVGNDGITRMVRACVEGPVFRGDQVRWDDVGTIPFDALGAPGWKPRPGASAAAAPDTLRGGHSNAG
jgi:dihydroorotate dehydrogenase electron transfer subunit